MFRLKAVLENEKGVKTTYFNYCGMEVFLNADVTLRQVKDVIKTNILTRNDFVSIAISHMTPEEIEENPFKEEEK